MKIVTATNIIFAKLVKHDDIVITYSYYLSTNIFKVKLNNENRNHFIVKVFYPPLKPHDNEFILNFYYNPPEGFDPIHHNGIYPIHYDAKIRLKIIDNETIEILEIIPFSRKTEWHAH